MAEPAASLGAALCTTGGVCIAGVTLGLQYEVLAAGLAGGLWSLQGLDPATPPWKKGLTAMMSALVAGYLAPGASELIVAGASKVGWVIENTGPLQIFSGVMIGLVAHDVPPLLRQWMKRKAEGGAP